MNLLIVHYFWGLAAWCSFCTVYRIVQYTNDKKSARLVSAVFQATVGLVSAYFANRYS